MKKLVKILIVCAFLILASAGFSACSLFKPSNGDDDCMHPISQYTYEYDEQFHWHPCTCEHDYTGGKLQHSVGSDGKCYCGYRIECTLVFKGNGVDLPSQTVYAGEKFTEPAAPVLDGYVFDCWKYKLKGTELWYEWDFECAAYESNLELTAFWIHLYTVTYDTMGGEMPEGTDSVQVYKYGEEIAAPVTPLREKFGFKGWSSSPDKYVAYDFKKNKTVKEDVTVYAFWEQMYYVDYHYMDGSGKVERQEVKKNYCVELKGKFIFAIERDHYEQLGWATEEGSSVAGTPDGYDYVYVTEDISLYALWVHTNNITYDGVGGWVYDETGFVNLGKVSTYTIRDGNTPYNLRVRRAGYTFVNWTDDTSTNEPFDFEKELESDVTVYAVWTYYTVNVRIDDVYEEFGEISYPSKDSKVTVGTEVGVWLNSYYIRGYEFDGWYSDDGQVESEEMKFSFVMKAENVSLTAKWRVKDEMSNFEFTSDRYSLKINSVKDKTVTEIVVPDYVTEIADCAFYGCNSVESITLPVIHEIDEKGKSYSLERAFFNEPSDLAIYKLRGDNYPNTLTTIIYTGDKLPNYAFYFLKTLTSITLSESLIEIPDNAFYMCENLTSITLPQGLTSIGRMAFGRCGLTSIDLPSTLEILCGEAFYRCDSITEVVIPESLKEMGSFCFYGGDLVSFTFAKSANWITTSGQDEYKVTVLKGTNYVDIYNDRIYFDWHISKY